MKCLVSCVTYEPAVGSRRTTAALQAFGVPECCFNLSPVPSMHGSNRLLLCKCHPLQVGTPPMPCPCRRAAATSGRARTTQQAPLTKVSAHDTVPGGGVLAVKLFLDVRCHVLLHLELIKRLRTQGGVGQWPGRRWAAYSKVRLKHWLQELTTVPHPAPIA